MSSALLVYLEPRCKYWSRAATTRRWDVTLKERQQEERMLQFVQKMVSQIQLCGQQHVVLENPASSAIWKESPLRHLDGMFEYVVHHCAYDERPNGRRAKKATKFLATFELKPATRQCDCVKGHAFRR